MDFVWEVWQDWFMAATAVSLASRTGTPSQAPSVLELVLAAQGHSSALRNRAGLSVVARTLVQFARNHGHSRLLAASATAERLVGAALMLEEGLELVDFNLPLRHPQLLIVEVAVAGALSAERAARRARTLGAASVDAVVLMPVPGGHPDLWAAPSVASLNLIEI